jgi:tRNA 2-thiouridine synthesizing protein A
MSLIGLDDNEEIEEPRVAQDVKRLTGAVCVGCMSQPLCGHAALLAIVLGFANAPRCPNCFARALSTSTSTLLADAYAHVSRRTCFSRAFAGASAREGFGPGPVCIFAGIGEGARHAPISLPSAGEVHAEWDAGDMSCGELVLELRIRMLALTRGQTLRVRATDAAAPIDIPAWCGLTGHTLVGHTPPDRYDIRRRGT